MGMTMQSLGTAVQPLQTTMQALGTTYPARISPSPHRERRLQALHGSIPTLPLTSPRLPLTSPSLPVISPCSLPSLQQPRVVATALRAVGGTKPFGGWRFPSKLTQRPTAHGAVAANDKVRLGGTPRPARATRALPRPAAPLPSSKPFNSCNLDSDFPILQGDGR